MSTPSGTLAIEEVEGGDPVLWTDVEGSVRVTRWWIDSLPSCAGRWAAAAGVPVAGATPVRPVKTVTARTNTQAAAERGDSGSKQVNDP